MDSKSVWLLILLPVALCGLAVVLYLLLGRGPRFRRAFGRIQHQLHLNQFAEALTAVRALQQLGPHPAAWEGQLRNAEGEALRQSGEADLAAKQYEPSLEQLLTSARLLGTPESAARERVVNAMLAEVRRLFGTAPAEIEPLIARILKIQAPCPEASFWLGLHLARAGQGEAAVTALRTAQEGAGKTTADPALYLGALLLKQGKPTEALRPLGEANRLEAGNPFIGWQLGAALVAAHGDASLAARALQRAFGPRGLSLWVKTPQRAFVDGFPDPARSYIARLTREHPFVCPVLGGDVPAMVRQGMLALYQAHYRLGAFQEAANVCETLLKEAAPTQPVLRGLGLALARLERYDEAFKHLRAAYDLEEPKSPITAGYLALCGAKGKPSKAEDKPNNVNWAVQLVSRYHEVMAGDQWPLNGTETALTAPAPQLVEWAGLCKGVFAEARALPVALPVEELRCCADVLAAVDAADADAAGAYDELAATSLPAVLPRHAWLYCRAAEQHGVRGRRDLDLFGLTFRHRAAAAEFFGCRAWHFAEIEFAYLERWAVQHPGTFPPELGADYPAQAETLLLDRAKMQESAGRLDAALVTTRTLLGLVPTSTAAYDRLAELHYRRDDLDSAARILAEWQANHPQDYRPLLRLAILQQQRGDYAGRTLAIDGALSLTRGRQRADIAFLGARLALAEQKQNGDELARSASEGTSEAAEDPSLALRASSISFTQVFRYLHECLREQPDHADASAMLAAARWEAGDRAGLAGQAAAMVRPDVADSRFQYLAAVCHLAAGDQPRMLEAAGRAATDPAMHLEARYLTGLAHLQRNEPALAKPALEEVGNAGSPSADHARAWLGRVAFAEDSYSEAVRWWEQLSAKNRAAWNLNEPFRGAVFFAALQAHAGGRYEQAADQFRQAGKLGWRDRNLGPLLALSLFKEGQRVFYSVNGDGTAAPEVWTRAASFLDQALKVGLKDPNAAYLLGLVQKRRGLVEEARTALRKVTPPDAGVALQLALLSIQQKEMAQAEQELTEAAQLEPESFPIAANLLLTRLALGKAAAAAEIAPRVVGMAPHGERWYQFTLINALLRQRPDPGPDPVLVQMTAEDEERLLKVLRHLGNLEAASQLLGRLAAARLDSSAPREAYFETQLVAGRRLLDRGDWAAAEHHLAGQAGHTQAVWSIQAAYFNLRGCAACLSQDFDAGIRHFQAALRLASTDHNIHQNLALAHEWLNQLDRAEMHWHRYFDLLERRLAQPDQRAQALRLACEGYLRLAGIHSEKERWPQALRYLESAQRLQPDNVEMLERLFHMYHQVRRPDQARRILQQLQRHRPGEPKYELYELDLIEINELDDLERWFNDVARVQHRWPGNSTVDDRASVMIGNAVSFMTRLGDQLTDQLNKVMKQVRSLDNYQINWASVHDVMRDLKREFQKLRRLVSRGHTMATHADHRRVLRDLADHLDRKIDYCRRWQGD